MTDSQNYRHNGEFAEEEKAGRPWGLGRPGCGSIRNYCRPISFPLTLMLSITAMLDPVSGPSSTTKCMLLILLPGETVGTICARVGRINVYALPTLRRRGLLGG